MLVRNCLRKAPVTVPPECTMMEAAGLMARNNVGSVLVTSAGALRGIVTDRDIAIRGVAPGQSPDVPVSEVMTERPVTVEGSADVYDVFQIFKDTGVRRLPVLEEDELAGIVTVDDLLVWLVLELGAVLSPVAREMVQHQSV